MRNPADILNKVFSAVGSVFGLNVFVQTGENHIGEVGGNSDSIRVTIPNTAESYNGASAPVVVGGKVEITNAMRVNGGTAVLARAGLIDSDNKQVSAYISFYSADPAGNYVNKQAPTNNVNDLKNLHLGTLQVSTSDYKVDGAGATAGIPGENMVLKSAEDSKSLWVVVKITNAMQSGFSNANALTLLINPLRD